MRLQKVAPNAAKTSQITLSKLYRVRVTVEFIKSYHASHGSGIALLTAGYDEVLLTGMQRLAELCSILVENAYGELAAV